MMLKKIVFMGTPLFAVPILKSLYEENGYSVPTRIHTATKKITKRTKNK